MVDSIGLYECTAANGSMLSWNIDDSVGNGGTMQFPSSAMAGDHSSLSNSSIIAYLVERANDSNGRVNMTSILHYDSNSDDTRFINISCNNGGLDCVRRVLIGVCSYIVEPL